MTNEAKNAETSEERKGVLLPQQEKDIDEIVVFENKAAEAADGVVIRLVDNQGLQRLKEKAETKYPGVSQEFIYPIVDGIMAFVSDLAEAKRAAK